MNWRGPSVIFVCTGNICRSAMAERVAQKWAADAGLSATFTSAGISDEEYAEPIYHTARSVLRENGYSYSGHQAHRITKTEVDSATLVIAMERYHLNYLRRLAPQADNLFLLTDFDPAATPGQGVPDPWAMPISAFRNTLDSIEAAMPKILDKVRESALKN